MYNNGLGNWLCSILSQRQHKILPERQDMLLSLAASWHVCQWLSRRALEWAKDSDIYRGSLSSACLIGTLSAYPLVEQVNWNELAAILDSEVLVFQSGHLTVVHLCTVSASFEELLEWQPKSQNLQCNNWSPWVVLFRLLSSGTLRKITSGYCRPSAVGNVFETSFFSQGFVVD